MYNSASFKASIVSYGSIYATPIASIVLLRVCDARSPYKACAYRFIKKMSKKPVGATAGGGAAAITTEEKKRESEAFVAALLKSRNLTSAATGYLTSASTPVTIVYRMTGTRWNRRMEWALCRCFFDRDTCPTPTNEKPACLYVTQINLTDDGDAKNGHACVLHLYDDDPTGKFTWACYDPNGTHLPSHGGVKYEAIQDALVQLYPGISHDTAKQYGSMPFTLGVQGLMVGQGNGGFCALLSLTRCKELVLSNDRVGLAEANLKKAAWQAEVVFKAYKDLRGGKESKFAFLDFDRDPALAEWDEGTLQNWADIETNQILARKKGVEIHKGSAVKDIRDAVLAVNPPAALPALKFCEHASQFSDIDTFIATRPFGISDSKAKAEEYVATYIQMVWDLRKVLFNLMEETGKGLTPEKRVGAAVYLARYTVANTDPGEFLDQRIFDGTENSSFRTASPRLDYTTVLVTMLHAHFVVFKHTDRCLVLSPWFKNPGDVPAATMGLAGDKAGIKGIVDSAKGADAFTKRIAKFAVDPTDPGLYTLIMRDLTGGGKETNA